MDDPRERVDARRPHEGRYAIARVHDDWYVACRSSSLRNHPLSVSLYDVPIVLFRTEDGHVAAFLDRCPHRNAPLSAGRVRGKDLECAYHGWRFSLDGSCVAVPGLMEGAGRNADVFAAQEAQGLVWVYATPNVQPSRERHRFPLLNETSYTSVTAELEVEATIHATAENALDVPHTAFLHGGLFRAREGRGKEVEVHVRREGDVVEAEFRGEERPSGLAGLLLAPRGGEVHHVDRFILPSTVQVEYRIGNESHLCISGALTPVSDFRTRIFAVLSFRVPFPGWLLAPILKRIAMSIFQQDAAILRKQTLNVQRFGGEQYFSTSLDVLGSTILKMLKEAERGERGKGSIKREVRTRI